MITGEAGDGMVFFRWSNNNNKKETNNKQTTTKWLESAHFGLRRYIAQARSVPKSENSPKLIENSENVGTLPNASGCIPTHPSRSVWVRMDPNALQNLEKLKKHRENIQQFAKHRAKIAKNRAKIAKNRACAVVVFPFRAEWDIEADG